LYTPFFLLLNFAILSNAYLVGYKSLLVKHNLMRVLIKYYYKTQTQGMIMGSNILKNILVEVI